MHFFLSRRRFLLAAAAVVLLLGIFLVSFAAGGIQVRTPVAAGKTVYQNEKASIDASNLNLGVITGRYNDGKNVRIKVQITKDGGITYTYNLNNGGSSETFPLTEGNGQYTVKVYENTEGTKYALAYSCGLNLRLEDEFAPFLYPNQYVNFNSNSAVVSVAADLVAGVSSDLDKVSAIYHYVVDNFTYDYHLAQTVVSGYLPDVDAVLAKRTGICFDYASVMAAMLRSQGIPCKLVIGYAGTAYHAWINVYIQGTGWVDQLIYFDGKNWSLMDPTFISSSKNDPSVRKYVGDGTNYSQKYAY